MTCRPRSGRHAPTHTPRTGVRSHPVAAEEPEGQQTTGDAMTQLEAVMWVLDGDPRLASGFANLTVLDTVPDRGVLRSRMQDACGAVPRLRQRVVERGQWSTPVWEDDPDFDIDRHIRWIDLGDDDLDQVAAALSARPFDRERPLWEFVVIEGLPDGAAAMVQRFDHTLTDGKGGIRLSVQFLDLERHPDRPAAPSDPAPTTAPDRAASGQAATGSAASGSAASGAEVPGGSQTAEVPSDGQPGDDGSGGLLGQAGRGLRAVVSMPVSVARGAAQVPQGAGNLFGLARDSVQQLAVDGRRSPIWTGRSTERWFGRTAINLDDVKEAAHSLGGSVNDLFVTGALVAAAQVHSDAGSPVDELRVAIPVSHRGSASNGGNAFTPVHSLLPSGDMSVTDRFRLVHQRLDRVKREGSVALDGPAAAARLLPSAALLSIVGRTTGAIDFVCSNVRAAPFDLYIAGAHLDGNYPLGPLLNTSFNLTTMSYRGWLFLGLLADRAAVTDPDGLLAALDDAYTEVLAAGGVSRRRLPARHQPA